MNTIIKKIVLTFSIMLLTIPAFAYDFEANGLYFKMISVPESTCELAKGDTPYKGDIVIPETVEYKNRQFTIVSIGDAFSGNKEVTNVVLPNTITLFNGGEFKNCTALQTVTLPDGLTCIQDEMFFGCSSLKTFAIPNSVKSIRDKAFRECTSLQSITIPNSVESIRSYAFFGCTSLTSIVLPKSLNNCGEGMFIGCTSLQTVTFPSSMRYFDEYMFKGCTSLTSITIPGSVQTIMRGAFSGCKNLKEVIFENNQSCIEFYFKSVTGADEFEKGLVSMFQSTNISTLVLGRQLNYYHTTGWNGNSGKFKDEKHIRWLFNNLTTLKVLKDCDPEQISLFSNISNLSVEDDFDLSKVNDLSSLTKLQTLTLKSTTPPICPKFSNDQYLNVILYVPIGTLETYQKADGWEYFFDIREIGVSSVNELQSGSRKEIGRYDINGNKIGEDFKGIIIVKFSDGSTKKFINR